MSCTLGHSRKTLPRHNKIFYITKSFHCLVAFLYLHNRTLLVICSQVVTSNGSFTYSQTSSCFLVNSSTNKRAVTTGVIINTKAPFLTHSHPYTHTYTSCALQWCFTPTQYPHSGYTAYSLQWFCATHKTHNDRPLISIISQIEYTERKQVEGPSTWMEEHIASRRLLFWKPLLPNPKPKHTNTPRSTAEKAVQGYDRGA